MINLGDKNWGVKDSGLLAYKQVGSKYFNKDFDFTRASNGTYVDKDGVLQTAELYNLLQYSNKFNTWTFDDVTRTGGQIGYDGFNNAWLIQYNTTASRHNINKSVSFSGSGTFSIYAKAKELQYIQIASAQTTNEYANFDLSDGSIGNVGNRFTNVQAVPVGNDWYRLSVTTANGYNFMYISIVTSKTAVWLESFSGANNTDGLYIQDAQLVEGTEPRDYQYTNGRVGIPRIDFSDGVGALLLEPQRTNNVPNSNNFNGWSASSGGTRELVSLSNPFGEDSIWKLGIDGNNIGRIQVNLGGATANQIFSGYFKGTGDVVELRFRNNSGEFLTLDFDANGVATFSGTNSSNYGIEEFGQGWYRVWLETTMPATNNFIQIYPNITSGATSGTIYAYGIQAEIGTYPTSLIKTEGLQVTRIADVANNCGTEQDFNSEEGVLYAEIKRFNGDTSTTTLSINDGSMSNMVTFYYFSTEQVYFDILSSSPNVSGYIVVDDTFSFNKIALKYKSGDIAIWINGQEVLTRTNTISLSGLNELSLSYGNNNLPFYGKVRSVKYFPTALTDEELQNLTT